ncbi:insulin-like growth factor-binding protein complex acid labile subunit, partial [Cylas formicarius]|uniref:insulin-like growth factor-binding protein complex acid labile subunit n=1 Tax=Cylas formicarius TaxID=197179 RepID=UPI002958965E
PCSVLAMDDEKIQPMWITTIVPIICLLSVIDPAGGVLCPFGCKCENEILRANCSGAGIEVVPIQLNPELHTMDLANNKIVQLHYTFSFYEKLITLDISRNKIKSLGNGNFRTQRTLKYLNLSSNLIESLGKETFEGLKQCTHLDLSYNQLESIVPNSFKELPMLEVLKVNGNQLDYFEDGLFESNTNLQELHLDDNSFMEIPGALSDLLRLKYLSLSRNLIETIEEKKVPNLPELHTLMLMQNIIFDIKEAAFASLPKLDRLDLSDNNLTTLPTAQLAKLSRLTNLKISGNSFQSLPAVAFRGLFHLKYLSLNQLEYLEYIDGRAFVDNIKLEKVSMDYNIKIRKLPTRLFHGNPKLRYISVRYNSIKTLEASHFPLDQLTELKVGGNPLECNCSMGWLWNLLRETEIKAGTNSSHTVETTTPNPIFAKKTNDLKLDVNDVTCVSPEDLNGKKLIQASQSQMDCSIGWVAIVSVSSTLIFILAIIAGVLFFVPKRKTKKGIEKELPKIVRPSCYNLPPPCPPPRKATPYEFGQVEKYKHVPLWDTYAQQCNGSMNIYDQLNDTRERPHIVYV